METLNWDAVDQEIAAGQTATLDWDAVDADLARRLAPSQPVRSRGLRRQPEVIQPPEQESELQVPPQAPPPQTEQATPQPRRQQVRFEGKIYEFEPTWSKESIGRWMTKNLMAERRGQTKLAPEQAGGRSKWTDTEPHAQQRRMAELGQQGLKEYAELLSGKDADGTDVAVNPEDVTPDLLARVIEDRKTAAIAAEENPNIPKHALLEWKQDTEMMEQDHRRKFANETTLDHKRRLAVMRGTDPDKERPTKSAEWEDMKVVKKRVASIMGEDAVAHDEMRGTIKQVFEEKAVRRSDGSVVDPTEYDRLRAARYATKLPEIQFGPAGVISDVMRSNAATRNTWMMILGANAMKAASKIKSGDKTFENYASVAAFLDEGQKLAEETNNRAWYEQASEGVLKSLEFASAIASGHILAKGARKAAQKVIPGLAGKAIGEFAGESASMLTTPGLQQMVARETIGRMAPQGIGPQGIVEGEPLRTALPKAAGKQLISQLAERSGEAVMRLPGLGSVNRALTSVTGKNLGQGMRSAGLTNPVGEWIEERVEDPAQAAWSSFWGDKMDFGPIADVVSGDWDRTKKGLHELAIEGVVLGVIGGPGTAASVARHRARAQQLKPLADKWALGGSASEAMYTTHTVLKEPVPVVGVLSWGVQPENARSVNTLLGLDPDKPPSRDQWRSAGLPPAEAPVRHQFVQNLRTLKEMQDGAVSEAATGPGGVPGDGSVPVEPGTTGQVDAGTQVEEELVPVEPADEGAVPPGTAEPTVAPSPAVEAQGTPVEADEELVQQWTPELRAAIDRMNASIKGVDPDYKKAMQDGWLPIFEAAILGDMEALDRVRETWGENPEEDAQQQSPETPPASSETTPPVTPPVPPGGGEVAADVEGAIDEDVQTAIGRLREAITTLDPEQQQKAIDDWTPVVDAASRGDEAATETILKMYGEVEDASAVRSTEGEVRQVEGGQDIRGTGKEQVPAEPAGEVAPARPEAEAEVPVAPPASVEQLLDELEKSSGKGWQDIHTDLAYDPNPENVKRAQDHLVKHPARPTPREDQMEFAIPGSADEGRHRGAVLSPSPRQKGKWQLTEFDDDGFSGDRTYNTRAEALKDLQREGFDPTDEKHIERLSETDRFVTGTEKTKLVGMLNELQGVNDEQGNRIDTHSAIVGAYDKGGLPEAVKEFQRLKEIKAKGYVKPADMPGRGKRQAKPEAPAPAEPLKNTIDQLRTKTPAEVESAWRDWFEDVEGEIAPSKSEMIRQLDEAGWEDRTPPKSEATTTKPPKSLGLIPPAPAPQPAVEAVPASTSVKKGDVVSWDRQEAEVVIPDLGTASWKPGNVRIRYTTGPKKGQTADVEGGWLAPLKPEETVAGKAASEGARVAAEKAAKDAEVRTKLIADVVPVVREVRKRGANLTPKTKKAKKALLNAVALGTDIRNEEILQAAIDQVAGESSPVSPEAAPAETQAPFNEKRTKRTIGNQQKTVAIRTFTGTTSEDFDRFLDSRSEVEGVTMRQKPSHPMWKDPDGGNMKWSSYEYVVEDQPDKETPPVAPPSPKSAEAKQPWEMTLPEYDKQVAGERVTEVASRTNTGRVIGGLRIHADALTRLNAGESIADDGFVTSKGRYVSRVEAAMLTGGDYWREVAEGRQEGAAEGVMAEPEEGRKPVQAAEFHRWSVERSKAPPATQQAVEGKIKGLKPKPATAPVAKAGPTSAEGVPSTVGGTQNEPGQGQQAAPAAESGGRGPGRSNRPPLRDLGSPGKRGRLNTASGKVFDVEYVAVEADDLIPSHDARRNFAKNEGSNPNERPYHDPKEGMSSRLTVQQIAEARDDKINLLVSDNESPTDGPPMVVEDGRVLGGNARTQGIQLGYFNGGEPAAKFKQLAVDNAAKFKLNPDAVASMKQPVIVRVLEGITDLGEMSRLLNKPLTAGKSASTEAVSVGSRISQGTAELVTSMLEPRGEEGAPSLREVLADTRKSSNLVKMLHADGAWSQDDIDKYVNPHTGDLNDAGKLQIEEALLGRIIADPKIVGGMSPGERRMVLSSLSPLSRIALHPKHGQRAGEIIKAAVEAFPSYKAADTPIRQYFMQQTSMMEMPGQGDESVASIVNAMDTMGTRGFKNGLEDVLDSLGIKTKQKGLFPSEIKKTETIDEAIAEVFPLPPPAKKKGLKEPSKTQDTNAPPSTPKAEPKESEPQGDLTPNQFADAGSKGFWDDVATPPTQTSTQPPAGKEQASKPKKKSTGKKGETKQPKSPPAKKAEPDAGWDAGDPSIEALRKAIQNSRKTTTETTTDAGTDTLFQDEESTGKVAPTPDLAQAMAGVIKSGLRKGYYDFPTFISNAAKALGEADVRDIGGHLRALWDKIRTGDPTGRMSESSDVETLLKPKKAQKEQPQRQPKTSEPESDTDKALRQAGLNVEKLQDGTWQITGNTYEHSKEIGDVKREQPDLGGWWHRDTKRWTFKRDPRRAIANRIAGAGTAEESGDARSRSEQVAREEARRREDERPDVQRTGGTYAASVDSSTKDLIARGLKHSITQEVVDSQIEDIGRVVDAAENERPMFVIGSAPGTGKTFVLGGVIRELRNRGFKKFIYVTQNQNLISQVSDNLSDYGMEGVEFTTYSKARETPPDTTGAVLLLDEAHSAKNTDRETGKSVSRMVSNARFTVYATATPFENVTEAEYLGYSGIFDGLHVEFDRPSKRPGKPFHNTLDGFEAWAWMFGANVYFIKKTDRSGREYLVPVVWWDKHQTAEADQFAANEWLKKRGVYVQHPMSLPPEAVNSEMRAVDADPYWADISNEVVQIYADAEAEAESDIEKGQINAHKVNVLKRLLETAKVDAAIARAKEIIGDGKKDDPQAIIFVNTKQDLNLGTYTLSKPYREHHKIKGAEAKRRYKPAEMDRMMQQWHEAREAAEMMGDGRASVGPPPFAPFIHKIAMAMDRADVLKKFPSVIDKIMDAFPGQAVEFSGRMTEAQNAANLAKWKANEAKLIVATMDKGGTGLSFHDTTGTMPSRYQVNMNLPWSGTKVEQVGGRLARYGTAKPVTLEWIFANNIPFDRELSKTVGSRMRSMSAAVQGRKSGAAKQIREFDFEADAPTEEITREQRVKEIQDTFNVTRDQAEVADLLHDMTAVARERVQVAQPGELPPAGSLQQISNASARMAEAGKKYATEEEFFAAWDKALRAVQGKRLGLSSTKRAVDDAVEDIASWLEDNPQFQDYYAKDNVAERAAVSQLYPELQNDAEWAFYKIIGAIASNSTQLSENVTEQIDAWGDFREAQRFDVEVGRGVRNAPTVKRSAFPLHGGAQAVKAQQYLMLNQIVKEQGGIEAAVEWLLGTVPSSQIRDLPTKLGSNQPSGRQVRQIKDTVLAATGSDQQIPRMFAFGPKLGAYAMNHLGRSEYTTIDVWESRFWRSFFKEADVGTGLEADTDTRAAFKRAGNAFAEKLGLSPSAAQAVRWYYMIQKVNEAGYQKARSNENISAYAQRQVAKRLGEAGARPATQRQAAKQRTGRRSSTLRSLLGGTIFGEEGVRTLAQEQRGLDDSIKGWTHFVDAAKAIIGGTDKADISTFIHEFAHPMRRFLFDRSIPADQRAGITDEDIGVIEDFSGVENGVWDRNSEERFATAWEQYWLDGNAPNAELGGIFQKIARWMSEVYGKLKELVGLTADVRAVFDKVVQRGKIPPGLAPQATPEARGKAAIAEAEFGAEDTEGPSKSDIDAILDEDADIEPETLFQAGEDPSKARTRKAVKLIKAAVGEGATTFDAFVEYAVDRLGPEQTLRGAPFFEAVWAALRQRPGFTNLGPVGKVADLIPMPRGSRVTGTRKPPSKIPPKEKPSAGLQDYELTGMAKAVMNDLRELASIPELTGTPSETVEQWVRDADSTIKADPAAPTRLLNEIIANPTRALDQHDVMLLAFRYRELANQVDPAFQEVVDASSSGDSARIARARTNLINARQPMTEFEELTLAAKSTWGRTGVALQVLLRKDNSVAGLLRRAREANHGEALTPEQEEEMRELAKKFADLQKKLDAETARADKAEAEVKSLQHLRNVVRQPTTRKKPSTEEKSALDKAWGKIAQAANVSLLFQETSNPYIEAVKVYRKLGVTTFSELRRHIAARAGVEQVEKLEDQFKQAWEATKPETEVDVTVDTSDLAALTKEARRIERDIVEGLLLDHSADAVVEMRDQIIDQVHEEMQGIVDGEFTRRQTMDALSAYGQFSRPSQDTTEKLLRNLNAEVLKLSQIDQLEAAVKRAEQLRAEGNTDEEIGDILLDEDILVAPTGPQRDTPSDRLRRMTAEYNELKKSVPASTEGRAGLLQTAVASIERGLGNRIRDLNYAIDHHQPINRGRKPSPTTPTIEDMKAERDRLLKIYREMFPTERKKLTPEQRLANAIKAADRSIAALENQIETRDFDKALPESLPASAELDTRKARLEQLRAQRDAAKALELSAWEGEGGTVAEDPKEAAYRKAYITSLRNRIADLQRYLAEGDFAPKEKKLPRQLSQTELDLKRELAKLNEEKLKKMAEYHLAHLHGIAWTADKVSELLHLARAIETSFDFSALLRQGGLAALGHPALAGRALTETIASIASTFDITKAGALKGGVMLENVKEFLTTIDSAKAELDFMHRLTNGEWGEFRQLAGLDLPSTDQAITRQEEVFQGRWGKLVPGVAVSSRLYTMILNKMRADMFDLMADKLGRDGKPTLDEAKLIANFVNVMTGRSSAIKWKGRDVTAALNLVFFAPRYVASRFQYLAMPFYLPFKGGLKANWQAKRAIYNEYGRTVSGIAAVLGMIAIAAQMFWDDDDEDKPTIEWKDMTVSDFLKVKIGETRLDFLAGLQQIFVLSSRMMPEMLGGGRIGDKKFGEGGPYAETRGSVLGRFARTKAAPGPGYVWTALNDWEDVVGNKADSIFGWKVHPSIGTTAQLFQPLSLRDVADTFQNESVPLAATASMLSVMGVGMSTYGPLTKYRAGTPEERKKQFDTFLENMKWDTPKPAYHEMLTEAQMKQVDARREEKKRSVIEGATSSPPDRKKHKTDKSYADSVKRHEKEMEAFRAMAATVSFEQAVQLLRDYYRYQKVDAAGRPRGSYIDPDSKYGESKDEYSKRLKFLRKLYGK